MAEARFAYTYNKTDNLFSAENAPNKIVEIYTFRVTRRKSNSTRKERLYIEAFENGQVVADIEARYPTLLDDLNQLAEYGVVLGVSTFAKLRSAIEVNYYHLPIEHKDFDEDFTETASNGLLSLIYSSIQQGLENEVPEVFTATISGRDMYCVTVTEFKTWISDSEYYRIDMTDLRKKLSADGFIATNSGRFDLTVKDGSGKARKCIAFFKKKLDSSSGK